MIEIATFVAAFLIVPAWLVAIAVCELLNAKRDKIICETVEYVRDKAVPISSLPSALAKRI